MSVPEDVRDRLRDALWKVADQLGWMNLTPLQKSKHYEQWTSDPNIGGLLNRFIDKGRVRLYIKDSLLKDYGLERLANDERPLRVMGITPECAVSETYVKPHGRRLSDGRIICWGRAEEWKGILMALHERSFSCKGSTAFAVVLLSADGRFRESTVRDMVQSAADKLGIERLIWLDT